MPDRSRQRDRPAVLVAERQVERHLGVEPLVEAEVGDGVRVGRGRRSVPAGSTTGGVAGRASASRSVAVTASSPRTSAPGRRMCRSAFGRTRSSAIAPVSRALDHFEHREAYDFARFNPAATGEGGRLELRPGPDGTRLHSADGVPARLVDGHPFELRPRGQSVFDVRPALAVRSARVRYVGRLSRSSVLEETVEQEPDDRHDDGERDAEARYKVASTRVSTSECSNATVSFRASPLAWLWLVMHRLRHLRIVLWHERYEPPVG